MGPIVNKILKGKETVLLEQLLNEHKFPDSHLVSDMRSGFALSGWVRNSKLFVPFLRPPRSTVAMQLALAPPKPRRHQMLFHASILVFRNPAFRSFGLCFSPRRLGHISFELDIQSPFHQVSWRRPRYQGPDNRQRENGGINSTIGLPEKFRLHDVTFIAAFIVCGFGDKRSKGAQVSGKTLDLKSAYKQYATRPERELMRIGLQQRI